jgi:hypothetical protein
MRPQLVIAALAAVLATQAQAQAQVQAQVQAQAQTVDPAPYAPPGDYRDQRELPPRPVGDDPAARAAWERARGEAYRRAPDAAQTEAELAATRALNAEIVAQNELAARQEAADRLAHDAALARHQIEVQQTEERARAAAEAARAAQEQCDRDYAAWLEQLRACQAGVRAACAAPAPRAR